MSIPASQIVSVNPRLLSPGGDDLEFNGLLLSDSPVIPSSQLALPFPDPNSVGEYFGLESAEYKAAVVYFQGYNNSFIKPRALYIAARVSEASAPFIRGGGFDALPSATLANLRQVTAGGMSLTLGNHTGEITGLNFSGAAALSNVAEILQAAIRAVSAGGEAWTGATVSYSSLFDAFTITGGAAGAEQGVGYAGPVPGAIVPATAATLAGGAITPGNLESVTDGGFKITINGAEEDVSGLDFTGKTGSVEEIAGVVSAALSAKGVSVTATDTGITIKTEAVGADATLSFASAGSGGTDVSALLALTQETGANYTPGADEIVVNYTDVSAALNLTQAAGAVLSPGLDAMSPAENLEAILDLTENFVCFTTVEKPSQEEALAFAEWASAQGVNYLYIYWDDDPRLLQAGNQDTIAAALTQAEVGATCGVWNSLEYAMMIMGTAACIDWNRRQGAITFAFKSQEGLAANVVRGADAQNLEAQNMNFMGDYATRNDNFVFMYPGRMFGSWTWIDTYLNAVWLNNALQVSIMTGFNQTPRVPYNQEGYALVRSWCQDPINRALYNGVIDTGVALSQSQITELAREFGRDISGELVNDGYVLKIGGDPDDSSDDSAEAAVRQQRESPECSLVYSYGGSIHRLSLASTAVV